MTTCLECGGPDDHAHVHGRGVEYCAISMAGKYRADAEALADALVAADRCHEEHCNEPACRIAIPIREALRAVGRIP